MLDGKKITTDNTFETTYPQGQENDGVQHSRCEILYHKHHTVL